MIRFLQFPDTLLQNNQTPHIILFLMLQLNKITKLFAKVKPLKINITTAADHSLKVKSETDKHEWEVKNALENVLASLVACEVSTLKDYSKRENFPIHSMKFTKVESSYDLSNYMKGGNASKLNEVTIDAEFVTNGTQEQLDALHKKVENSCPVYQMIKGSGVKITNNWKNIKKQ